MLNAKKDSNLMERECIRRGMEITSHLSFIGSNDNARVYQRQNDIYNDSNKYGNNESYRWLRKPLTFIIKELQ